MTLLEAFAASIQPLAFLTLSLGVFLGIVVGALPGMTGGMLMALTLPFTYYMTSSGAITLLIGMYVGGISGGLITATLMRIPGEPASVMTTLDGYPLARKGQPGRALGLGISASLVGGAFSWVALVLLSPPLAELGLKFGPFENFALAMLALVLISSLSQRSFVRGLIAGLLGMLVGVPGLDETSGLLRFTFGIDSLSAGLNLLPVILGVFALSQVFADLMTGDAKTERVSADRRGILISVLDYWIHGWNMLRSAAIGIFMGAMPGVGASVASIAAYTTARNMSKTPEAFGTGSEEGIVASETANNASSGGTLIPIITLGLPGGFTDAVLLAALMIHNLQPGPHFFATNKTIVNTIMAAHLVSHLVMFLMMVVGSLWIVRLVDIPKRWISTGVLVLCMVSAFALNGRMFDVWTMLAFGAVGLALEYVRVPLAPFAIGLILGPMAEMQFRAAMMWSDGSLAPLFTRPISLTLLIVALALFAWPFWRERRLGRATSTG
ncbi:MAG: tripartite tricarboxylate transporter permease [Acidimicrobiia bacterium]